MSNKYIVPIGALIVAILIITGGFLLLNPHQPGSSGNAPEDHDNHLGEFIENSSAGAHALKITVSAEELQKNTKPSFKVGKKYKYKTTSQGYCMIIEKFNPDGSPRGTSSSCSSIPPTNETYKIVFTDNEAGGGVSGGDEGTVFYLPKGSKYDIKNETNIQIITDELSVEKIERVNKSDCFVISKVEKESSEEIKKQNNASKSYMPEPYTPQMHLYYYYDKENGKLVQITAEGGGYSSDPYGNVESHITNKTYTGEESEFIGGSIVFSEWMLALNDNFIWERISNISIGSDISSTTFTYAVEGREKVNNRDCFKVEVTEKTERNNIKSSGMKKVVKTSIVWVDVTERILVKQITKFEGLTTSTTELTDEI